MTFNNGLYIEFKRTVGMAARRSEGKIDSLPRKVADIKGRTKSSVIKLRQI